MDTTATSPATTLTGPTTTGTRTLRRPPRTTLRPATGRRGAAALVVSVLTALAVLVAGPASAWTTTANRGVAVQPTVYAVQGSHYGTGSAVTGTMYKPWLYQSGPVVYRVAGSGAQTVRVVYTVDRWNGYSWVQRHTAQGSATIGAGYTSVKVPNLSLLPSDGSGYYRVRLDLTYTNAIGAYLASTSIRMDGTRDYTCSTARTCSVGSGFVYLGA